MATAARFGRLPRNAPSLTSTIVALAQEYQRVRDSNIETAWQDGGQFEGHKVTDEKLLAYWKQRRSNLSPDDPNWDVVNNRIHGYEFNIAETKHYLAYKRGHLSEQGMANFYSEWANKMPSNSANWRDLMTKAAQFKASAARGRAGSNAQARANAYGAAQQHTYDTFGSGYDILQNFVMGQMLQSNNIDQKDVSSTSPESKQGWGAFTVSGGQNDPAAVNAVLSWLETDPNAKATRIALTKAIQKNDPNFSGHFTPADIGRLHDRSNHGDDVSLHRAKHYGHDSKGVTAIRTHRAKSDAAGAVLGSSNYVTQATAKQGELDALLNDKTMNPVLKAQEYENLAKWFAPGGDGEKLLIGSFPHGAMDPGSRHYNPDAASLLARNKGTADMLRGNPSGLSIFDDPEGNKSFKGGDDSTYAAKVGKDSRGVIDATNAVYGGKEVLVHTNSKGDPTDNPTGYSTYSVNDPRLKAGNMVPIPGSARDTGGLPVYQQSKPLTVHTFHGIDPNTGEGVGEVTKADDSPNVGQYINWHGDDGIDVPLFGVTVAGGQVRWMSHVPTTNGATMQQNADGTWQITQTVNPGAPFTPNASGFGPPATARGPGQKAAPAITVHNGNSIDRGTIGDPNANVAWDTPIEAGLFQGGHVGHQVTGMSDADIHANAAAYLKDHMTPAMVGQIRRGAKPEDVVNTAAMGAVTATQGARQWGLDPDERSRNLAGMQGQANAMAAQNAQRRAATPGDQEGRAALVAGVTDWRNRFDSDPANSLDIPNVSAPGYYGRAGAFGPPGQRAPRSQNPPLPVGYGEHDIGALVTNPSITTSMAAGIAAYLTNGAVGGTLPGQTPTQNGLPAGMPRGVMTPATHTQLGPPTPTSPVKPTMVTTPAIKIKPTTRAGGGDTSAPGQTPTVNAATGFTTGTTSLNTGRPRQRGNL